jgi:hypothetical protein
MRGVSWNGKDLPLRFCWEAKTRTALQAAIEPLAVEKPAVGFAQRRAYLAA